MKEEHGVLVVGSLNLDIIQKVPAFPKVGESLPAEETTLCAGGKGANQAAQCARLGIPTRLMGWIGNDLFGDFLLKSLSIPNLDLSHVKRVETLTGLGVVNTLPDRRLFAIVSKGANYAGQKEDLSDLDQLLNVSSILALQLEIPADIVTHCIGKAKEQNVRVCLNAAPNVPLRSSTISDCDFFIVNEVEASFYTGEPIETLNDAIRSILPFAKTHRNICIFTLGEKGSVISDGNSAIHIPAHPTKVIETTGAGDSFIGGFIRGLIDGFSIWDSAKFASRCSAVTIGHIGGIESMPTFEAMRTAYEEIREKKGE